MKSRSTVAWTAVVVAAAFVGFTANAAASDDEDQRSNRRIEVSGTATVSTRPDQAVIDLAVRSESHDGAVAMEENAGKMDAMIDAIAAQGVTRQDIETTQVSLERRTLDRGTDDERIVFVARNAIRVTIVDLATTGAVIDAAVGAGATDVRNIRFQVSDPTEVRRQALQEAVRAARAKADAMASAAGTHVDRVVSISEQGNAFPEAYEQRLAFDAVAAATPIVPTRDIQTRVTVTVVWSLPA